MTLPLGAFSVALAVMVTLSACAGGRHRFDSGDPPCRKFDLDSRPAWLFSGEWVNDGTELILPDTLAGRLLRYERSGDYFRPVAVPNTSATFRRPGAINNTGRGLVVLDVAERLVALREDFQPAWEVRLRDLRFRDGDRVGMFLSFIEADGDFLGYTTLVDEDRRAKWWGIARLRLGDPPAVERVHSLPSMDSEEGSFYLSHTGPYLATVRGAVYALFFGPNPHIEQLLPARRKLVAFPAEYVTPELGPSTRENMEPAFRVWERSAAPVALFGRGEFLYLLTRRPRAASGTQWTIYQIDPQRDQMLRSIELPTRANHLVVVPGPREWAIVEKGSVAAVSGTFEQLVGPVVFVPSSRIEDGSNRTDLSACLGSRR